MVDAIRSSAFKRAYKQKRFALVRKKLGPCVSKYHAEET